MSDYLEALQALNRAGTAVSRLDPDHPALDLLSAAISELHRVNYDQLYRAEHYPQVPA